MRRDRRHPRATGFTLLELMVAITVLSIVSLIAWRGLDSLVHTRERLQPEADGVRAILVAFGQLERDLAQVVNTTFVPLPGAPVAVREGAATSLEMMRIAPHAEGEPSAVQLIVYEVRDGRLMRLSSPPMIALGGRPTTALVETPLLADVQAFRVRLWQPGRGWAPAQAVAAGNARGAPPGIEVVVERSDGRQYRRVLLVGMG